jgi:hypothetical protein
MMSYKTGYSRRTAINHMHKLVALRIFSKTVYRLKFGNAFNLYKLLLPVPRLSRTIPSVGKGESAARTLPEPKTGEAKELSLEEELRRLRKGLRFLSNPDTPMYQACIEKIAALEALQQRTYPEMLALAGMG